MAFVKKTWKDRIAEFPTRRRLTKEDNTSELVTVAREEGTLSQEGDAFSAENMNDLENRIDAEFTEVNGKLHQLSNNIDVSNEINLITYTNSSSPFICPSDGVVRLSSSGTYNRKYYINLIVNDFMLTSLKGNGEEALTATYRVFKGDKLYVGMNNYANGYGPWESFYPYSTT